MSTVAGNDVDDIRREMSRIRREMHEDVKGVVDAAEAAADWRHYLSAYPWVSLTAAFSIGYFLVPRKPPGVEDVLAEVMRRKDLMVDAARPVVQVVKAPESKAPEPKTVKKGLLGAAFSLLAPLALRTIQGYAAKYVENWVAQQPFPSIHDVFSPPAPGSSPGQSPGFGPAPPRPRPHTPGDRRPL